MAVIHIGLFWRRFRFSFRAYSFLQQLRLMRRKRCSRPSLKESTSGRCNYDLTCYFSFLSHFYFFPPFSSFLFFRLFLFLSHFSNEGRVAQRKWGNVFPSVTMKLATKPCRCCIQTRALSLSLSLLERFFIHPCWERGGKIVWRSYDRFLFTLALGFFPRRRFRWRILPRFRIFKRRP